MVTARRSWVAFVVSGLLAAGCADDITGPTPDITVPGSPSLVCNAQKTFPVALTGTGLSPLSLDTATQPPLLALPEIELLGQTDLSGTAVSSSTLVPDDPENRSASQVHWTSLTAMRIDITPSLALAPGVYGMHVTNRNGNEGSIDAALAVVPPPTLTKVEPVAICIAQGSVTLSLTGTDFLRMETAPGSYDQPTITLSNGSGTYSTQGTVDPASCVALPAPASNAVRCTRATVTVPQNQLPVGTYDVQLTNPAPADCHTTEAIQVAILPPPTLTSVVPAEVCIAQGAVILQLTGTDFLRVETSPGVFDLPTVVLTDGTSTFSTTPVVDATSCTDLVAPASAFDRCTRLSVTVPQNQLPPGSYGVQVTNPLPANCHTTETVNVDVVPPPDLVSAAPTRLCVGGGTLTLTGTFFRAGATVTLGGVSAQSVTVNGTGTSASATFGGNLVVSAVKQDLAFTNVDGCFDVLPNAVDVVDGPILFWADPSITYDQITTNVTLYASGLNGTPTAVRLIDSLGVATPLTYVLDAKGRIQATLAAGQAAGAYTIEVVDTTGCSASLPNGLTVVSVTDASLTAIDPPFAYTGDDTAVTLDGSGAGGAPLTGAERVYLNPHNASSSTIASPMRALSLVNPGRLAGVVPSGLPPAVYDVIMVTPDGHVALLDSGLTVTANAAPVIDVVTPAQVVTGGIRALTARGVGFSTPAATWTCRNFTTPGPTRTLPGTVTGSTATSANLTIDTTAALDGDVCVLRLTNADGTYADYSAITVTGPASNIQAFQAGTAMSAGRRALGLAVGRTTRAARYLHAIGGDGGAVASASNTIESVSIDLFGQMGAAWTPQRNNLPAARTFATAQRIGDYIYLVGGNDGTANLASVLRAEVLDPLDAPEVTDVTAVRKGAATEPGLDAGLWYYRVAAVFPGTDLRNPNGESLASDPTVVQLPTGLPDKLFLSIEWPSIPGASGYRIYRSPAADAALSAIELLAQVASTGPGIQTFQDRGLATTAGQTPVPFGSLGMWAAQPSMSVPRAAAGVADGVDPSNPNRHYLYAFGGRNAAGTALASFEFLQIDVNADGTHVVAPSFTAGSQNLGSARAELGTFVLDNDRASRIPVGQNWIYAAGGRTNATTTSGRIDAGQVLAGGQLSTFRDVGSNSVSVSGYGYAGRNNFLYVFGGAGGAGGATNNVLSAELCATGLPGCNTATIPPDVVNWNAAGISMTSARYLPGSTTEGSFIYVVGGVDAANTLLSSTDRDVY